MSNEKAHLAKAERNEQFFEDVLELHSDWAVVGLFYSTVHYVEAYLSKRLNIHSNNHEDRKSHINSIPDLKNIYKIYSELQNISRNIRYNSLFPNTDKALEYKKELYDPIQDHIIKLLKK